MTAVPPGQSRGGGRAAPSWPAWLAQSVWYASSTRPAVPGGAPANDGAVRVSDAEREAVADALSSHFSAGRLDAAELEERLQAAMGAKTRGDLAPLLADLPAPEPPAPAPPSGWQRLRAVLTSPRTLSSLAGVLLALAVLLMLVGVHNGAAPLFVLLALLVIRRQRRMRRRARWHDNLHAHEVPHWHGPRGPVLYPGWWPYPPGGMPPFPGGPVPRPPA